MSTIVSQLASYLQPLASYLNPIESVQVIERADNNYNFHEKPLPGVASTNWPLAYATPADDLPSVHSTNYYRVFRGKPSKFIPITMAEYKAYPKLWRSAYVLDGCPDGPFPIKENKDGTWVGANFWGEKHVSVNWKKLGALASAAGFFLRVCRPGDLSAADLAAAAFLVAGAGMMVHSSTTKALMSMPTGYLAGHLAAKLIGNAL